MTPAAPVKTEEHVTLVAANVTRNRHLWTAGQKLYVCDHAGGDRVQVVGRHRRKHQRWIFAYIDIKSLGNFRIQKVFDPAVVGALRRDWSHIDPTLYYTTEKAQNVFEGLKQIETYNQAQAWGKRWGDWFSLPISGEEGGPQ